jgi:tetratricopeptide (TPR) repeat protein
MPLDCENKRHLNAAQGYVELGMHLDANEELEKLDPDVRTVPEVLAVRLQIYAGLEKWELMRIVADKLASFDPNCVEWAFSLAYATRRAQSIESARTILLEAVERHPNAAALQYELACQECLLGELETAKARLHHAFKLDARLRLSALDDVDLERLWASLGEA